jgi:hypothetical protein
MFITLQLCVLGLIIVGPRIHRLWVTSLPLCYGNWLNTNISTPLGCEYILSGCTANPITHQWSTNMPSQNVCYTCWFSSYRKRETYWHRYSAKRPPPNSGQRKVKISLAPLITNTGNRFLDHPTRLRLIISSTEVRLCGAAGTIHRIDKVRYTCRALVQVFAHGVFPVL